MLPALLGVKAEEAFRGLPRTGRVSGWGTANTGGHHGNGHKVRYQECLVNRIERHGSSD